MIQFLTAAMKKVLSPISVTKMTTSDFTVALKKSVPRVMASSESIRLAFCPTTGSDTMEAMEDEYS